MTYKLLIDTDFVHVILHLINLILAFEFSHSLFRRNDNPF
jgi:hypothetical protein